MSCFSCLPGPASLQPRKIYNILVPDVFPKDSPPVSEPVPSSIKRKIGKLHEYVQQSPGQIAKVSRRLNRRIKQALYDTHFGYVKIAVATYTYLLKQSSAEKSRYTPSYFSKELIEQPDAVINTLLNYGEPEVQAMGAELLAAYIEAQTEVENQPLVVEELTSSVVRLLLGKSPGAAGAQAPKLPESTKAACMLSIREYVKFCQKVKKIPKLLPEVQECILVNVDLSSKEVQQLLFVRRTYVDAAAVSPGGAAAPPLPSSPSKQTSAELALSVMGHLRPYMQDVGVVHRLLDTQLGYLDRGSKWEQATLVDGMLGLIEHACGEQTFPLFTSLLRHSSVPGLPTKQRAIVIRQAVSRSALYPLSAISLALAELPRTLALAGEESGSSGAQELQELKQTAQEAVQKLALQVGDVAQVCEALAGALRQHSAAAPGPAAPGPPAPRPVLLVALELGVAAVQAVQQSKGPGRTFPPRVSPTSLLTQLCGVIWEATPRCAWSEQPPALDARRLSVQTLHEVTRAPGFGVREERPALGLVAAAAALATAAGAGARDLAAAAELTAAAAGSGRPDVLAQLAVLAVGLRSLLLKEQEAAAAPATCSGLLLVDVLLQQLSGALRCPGLLKLVTGGQALQAGAGGLSVVSQGRPLPVLQAPEQAAKQEEGLAKTGVQAAAAVAGGHAKWVSAFAAALGSEGALAGAQPMAKEAQRGVADAAAGSGSAAQVRELFAPLLLLQLPLAGAGAGASAASKRTLDSSALVSDQARLLSQRVEESWSIKQAGRAGQEAGRGEEAEQVNLERVLLMLETDQQALAGAGPHAAAAASARSRSTGRAAEASPAPQEPLTIAQVLELVSGLSPSPSSGGKQGQDGRAAGSMRLDMRALARQLEPLGA